MITDPYVPQVGHLVTIKGRTMGAILVVEVDRFSGNCHGISPTTGRWQFTYLTGEVTFLADRSAEWEALFQLDTPTP